MTDWNKTGFVDNASDKEVKREKVYLVELPLDRNSYVLHPMFNKEKIVDPDTGREAISFDEYQKPLSFAVGRVNANLASLVEDIRAGNVKPEEIQAKVEELRGDFKEKKTGIAVYDKSVSSPHLVIGKNKGGFYVCDKNSRHGSHYVGVCNSDGLNSFGEEIAVEMTGDVNVYLPREIGEEARVLFGNDTLELKDKGYLSMEDYKKFISEKKPMDILFKVKAKE